MPYSDIARDCLLKEGFPLDRIIKTGSPIFEVIQHFRAQIEKSDVLSRLKLQKNSYFVVSTHREENVDNPARLNMIFNTLNAVADGYGLPIIFSTHPRTAKRIEGGDFNIHPNITLMKPLGFLDYNALQMSSLAVLSDSGTISEEASILRFRALNLRETHERHEAMEEGTVMMTGISSERVLQCLEVLLSDEFKDRRSGLVADYSQPDVSDKVVKIIFSYVSYVNRVVWGVSEC